MKTTKSTQLRVEAEQIRLPLETWRKTRKIGARIPEPLWAAMARLAQSYGVNPVSELLRVPYYALRDRVVGAKTPKPATGPKASFVEVKGWPALQPLAGVLELEDRTGSKLRLRLDPGSSVDALALVQAFWKRGA